MSWVQRLWEREELFRRAPSAHNTQPWTVSYAADQVEIGWDPARALPVADPTRRDLYLGIGAFVETCLIVAADTGLAVDAEITADRVRLVPAAVPYPTAFTASDVAERRVARGRYAPGQVPAAVLAELEPGLRHLPTRDLAADLAAADRWMFGEPAVTAELRDWLRLSPRHPRYHLDGLTDRALALTRTEAVLLDGVLRAYPMGRRLGLPALLAAGGRGLLRHDGSVLVQVGGDRGPAATIAAGRRLLRTWLRLARHGLAVHPLSQLIDCPATAARLAERVGGPPLAVFRVGRPLIEPVRSARLPPGAGSAPGRRA
ncbi:hypothetical protein O7627_08320 [Solwaraspora sp. WMMD1047]|uniref:hypothetical protein n=1 Tax=Solwaraspora sp. WMMD1047 TaxID=3016102 RepID=UPI002417A8E1|nr:hypothetical protein [Solwaraspora sp. WMMD1047]MDG4829309.1 hypothetical protein [Solwaraspora sp. WMMD1047]